MLQQRAETLTQIRSFFAERAVLEVDVPVFGKCGITDPHIDCISVDYNNRRHYLQSSPEYFMKRLLAAGTGDIYYLGKAFRAGEAGVRHNPEFTMLEWYRRDWAEHRLINEVTELVQEVVTKTSASGALPTIRLEYGDVFQSALHLNPHTCSLPELQQLAAQTAGSDSFYEERATCLDLLFSLKVEPQLQGGIVTVYNYPECQAALARTDTDATGNNIARRFEVFVDGLELANGYFELCDVVEQKKRFEKDAAARREAGKPEMIQDEKLLAALESGMPSCAGVALGVDRLLMICSGQASIESVLPFSFGDV